MGLNVFQLASSAVWRASPGCRVLMVDNGGLRLDVPEDWIVYSPGRQVFLIDRFPPDNRCMMAISCLRVHSGALALPLLMVLEEYAATETRAVLQRSSVIRWRRWPLEAVWVEMRVCGPQPEMVLSSRVCVARADGTQVVIVLEFHPNDESCFDAVWQTAMETLTVGDYVMDVTRGRKRVMRG